MSRYKAILLLVIDADSLPRIKGSMHRIADADVVVNTNGVILKDRQGYFRGMKPSNDGN